MSERDSNLLGTMHLVGPMATPKLLDGLVSAPWQLQGHVHSPACVLDPPATNPSPDSFDSHTLLSPLLPHGTSQLKTENAFRPN